MTLGELKHLSGHTSLIDELLDCETSAELKASSADEDTEEEPASSRFGISSANESDEKAAPRKFTPEMIGFPAISDGGRCNFGSKMMLLGLLSSEMTM